MAAALSLTTSGVAGAAPGPNFKAVEVATFLAPQTDLLEPYPGPGLTPQFSEFRDQTLRQVVRLSAGGKALKIKFSNQYGTTPVTFDKVTFATSLGLGTVDPATVIPVTFHGGQRVTLPPGGEVFTDPIALSVKPLSEVAVSIYMRGASVRTAHRLPNTTAYVGAGDQTSAVRMVNPQKTTSTYYMPEIVAIRDTRTPVIVAFGDSITDGGATTRNAYMSWPDQLAAMANPVGASVVNAGIGGNRWVKGNMGPCGGCRFDRDVLNVPGVTHVVFQLGVNDLGLGYRFALAYKDPSWIVSARQITDAMQAAIDRAKAKGIKVYLTTIVPFKARPGAPPDYYTDGQPDQIPPGMTEPYNGERIRQQVNDFIRNNRTVGGVIDIDKALADPSDPLHQRRDLTVDGLHPNDAGSTLFAQLVYLAIFRSAADVAAR